MNELCFPETSQMKLDNVKDSVLNLNGSFWHQDLISVQIIVSSFLFLCSIHSKHNIHETIQRLFPLLLKPRTF